jgi:alpha-aminoadipic semialdehyde synthase
LGTIGIRREDKSRWERRVPLVPADVARLVREDRVSISIQPSLTRIFSDEEYRDAGATIAEDLSSCGVVLGIKELPLSSIQPSKTYMLFSHTIKGQPHNMPMLRRFLDRRCTLLDHELVTGEDGKRLIAFGRFAGIAGTIDALWILGRRFQEEGIRTPFLAMKPAHAYVDLEDARRAVRILGEEVGRHGLPSEARPFVVGLTGRGNVGFGAREILDLLPIHEVRPHELAGPLDSAALEGRTVVLAHWQTPELVAPRDSAAPFSRESYRADPQSYRSLFAPSLPHLTVLLHGIQWSLAAPRFVTRDHLRELWRNTSTPSLRVIADITCDVNGSLECTVRTTDPGNPAYVYDPHTGTALDGIAGRGPVVVPVEIFPAEFPKDASSHFSQALSPLIAGLARMNPALGPADPNLPAPLQRSAIAAQGRLVPPWEEKLREALLRHGSEA